MHTISPRKPVTSDGTTSSIRYSNTLNRAPPGQSVALQPSASAHSAAARNTPFNGAASECTQLPQHSAHAMPQSRPKTRPNLAYRTTQKQNTPYPIVTQHFHCGVRVKGRRSPHRRRVHPAAAPQTCVAERPLGPRGDDAARYLHQKRCHPHHEPPEATREALPSASSAITSRLRQLA